MSVYRRFKEWPKNYIMYQLNTNKTIWELEDSYFLGLYKNYVVATSADSKFYLIIDKSTGLIEDKIPSPISKRGDFDFYWELYLDQ